MNNNLNPLFKKYKHLIPKDKTAKDTINKYLEDNLRIKLKGDFIHYKKNIIYLHIHPAIKQRLLPHHKNIISELEKRGVYVNKIT